MAGRPWSDKELEYLTEKAEAGWHYTRIAESWEKVFGFPRTIHAVFNKARTLGISFAYADRHAGLKPAVIEKRIEHEKQISALQKQLRELQRKYHEALHGLDLQEKLVTAAKASISALPPVKQPKPPKPTKTTVTEEAVMLLSDIHYGEEVSSAEMRGLNEYSRDIANARLKSYVETVTDLASNKLLGYRFPKLHLFCLGDWVSGTIHDELVEHATGNIVEWTVELAFIVAQMVRELLTAFPQVSVVAIYGNHGRMHRKPRYKRRFVNWDWVCYQFMSMFLANEIARGRVQMRVPKSFYTIEEVAGHGWLLFHGDGIRSWQGIPHYGIQRTASQLKEICYEHEAKFKYMALGHFHQQVALERVRGEVLINGSVIGGNEYSIGKMFSFTRASQLFAGVHPAHGITHRWRIDLHDRRPSGALYEVCDLSAAPAGMLIHRDQ